MKQKCEVPGCDKEHMWMKDGKLVCSTHYWPPNEIKWVDEVQQARVPETPLLDVKDFDEDGDYRKLWEKIEPCIDPDTITDEKIQKFMSEISFPEPRDLHPDDYPSWAAPKSKINIHKGNEAVLDEWTEPWENQLVGMQGWKPEGKLEFTGEQFDELQKKMKRFTQGLSKVSYEYSAKGIIPHYKEPDIEGVCETFHPASKTYCPEPAMRREDVFNHYLCEKCYQTQLNKQYPKINRDDILY